MAQRTLINTADDMRWLREVHLPRLSAKYKSAIIFGNEDSPVRVEVFEHRDPVVTDVPLVFVADEEGVLTETEQARRATYSEGSALPRTPKRHHATKKSPAQLQREIDEVLATPPVLHGDRWISQKEAAARAAFDPERYERAVAEGRVPPAVATRIAKAEAARRKGGKSHSTKKAGSPKAGLPLRDDVTELEYHRPPTASEIRFGEGATHYRTFPVEEAVFPGTRIPKKWLVASDDGLRYYR